MKEAESNVSFLRPPWEAADHKGKSPVTLVIGKKQEVIL